MRARYERETGRLLGDWSRAGERVEPGPVIISHRRSKGGCSSAMTGEAEPFERARQLYDQACFNDDQGALEVADRVLNDAEAALALARARIMHARFLADRQERPQELVLAERAAALYQQLDDGRGEGEALFWAGAFHQVVREDGAAARPMLERARELAAAAGDKLTLSYAVRHLGFAEMGDGHLDAARRLLEESVRLRRDIGFMPGVAAGILALAELAACDGDHNLALNLLDEAASVAAGTGAAGVLRWVDQARQEI
jgi:tetratricopeptide (TPR) repeat protein